METVTGGERYRAGVEQNAWARRGRAVLLGTAGTKTNSGRQEPYERRGTRKTAPGTPPFRRVRAFRLLNRTCLVSSGAPFPRR